MERPKPLTFALSLAQVMYQATCRIIFSAIKVETSDMMWVFSNIWQPDKAIAAINEARRDLEQAYTGHTEETGAEGREVDEEGGAGGEVVSSSTRLVRCWPARARLEVMSSSAMMHITSGASMPQPGMPSCLPSGHPPFLCCVRIERLQLRGARRADGAALPRPLQLTIHAPLILQNTLPISLRWVILVPRNELLQDRYYASHVNFSRSCRPHALPSLPRASADEENDLEADAVRGVSRRLALTAARTRHLRMGANKLPLKTSSRNEIQLGESQFRRPGFVDAPSSKQAPRNTKLGTEGPLAVEVHPKLSSGSHDRPCPHLLRPTPPRRRVRAIWRQCRFAMSMLCPQSNNGTSL